MGGEKPGLEQTLPASGDTQPEGDARSVLEVQPGDKLGRYRVISRIGAGAMGIVWCASDPQLDRKVAIKVVHANLARSPEASQRLLREARAMAKLSHRAVVTVHDAGEADGRLFLAMELVEGTTLGHMLRTRTDAHDWRRWLAIMIDAGRGLEAAHGAGVLHRDFKPENVLVDANGRVCVADFGLATLGDDHPTPVSERISKANLELTTTGALLGTPAYMSPQQLQGEPIDARADQFSFCVATYEALYGHRPFATDGRGLALIESLEAAIRRGDVRPPPPGTRVPGEVVAVLRRGLAASPADRWPDMTALLAALERAARRRGPRRVRALAGVASVVAIGGFAFVLARDDTAAPVAQRRHDVPLKTQLAVTPDGKRLVLASDRLEVRELGGTRTWTTPLPFLDGVTGLIATNTDVTFGGHASHGVRRWHYASDGRVEQVRSGPSGSWAGETVGGHVFYPALAGHPIVIHDGTRVVRSWIPEDVIETLEVSPDRTRIASLESQRFTGRIVIRNVVGDGAFTSPRFDNPTAVAWQDDRTIVYATGTSERPTIFRMRVDAHGFGTPEVLHAFDTGWIGEIAIGGGRMFFLEMGLKARARLVDGTTQSTRDLDTSTIGAAIAWTDDADGFLVWNRSSRAVERRTLRGSLDLTTITLAAEPANATLAGDVLIAAVRGSRGRDVVAHRISTGQQLWQHPAPAMLLVRCADDRRAPCFALQRRNNRERLVAIDPETGVTGERVVFEGSIEDIAVDTTGTRIVVAVRSGPLFELAADGRELARHATPLLNVRSVAYDRGGGFLVAGTLVRNTFQVGRLAGGSWALLAQAENDLLSLVRPSADGRRVLVHARTYAPSLWELALR